MRLTDAKNAVIVEHSQSVDRSVSEPGSVADYEFEVPVNALAPGDYLVSVDVVAATMTAQRQLRFRVERDP